MMKRPSAWSLFFLLLGCVLAVLWLPSLQVEGFTISDIADEVNKVGDLADTIPDELRKLNQRISQRMDDVASSMQQQVGVLNDRLQSVNSNLDALPRRIQDLDNQLQQVPSLFSAINHQVYDVTNKVNDVPNQFDRWGDQLRSEVSQQVRGVSTQLNDVADKVNDVPRQLQSVRREIEDMGQQVERQTVQLIDRKLKSVFTQLGDVFRDGLIHPIWNAMQSLGRVAEQLGSILEMLGQKITGLPGCLFTYFVHESMRTLYAIYYAIMPSVLRHWIDWLYQHTLGVPIEAFLWLIGYSDSVRTCYAFRVDDEVRAMRQAFLRIGNTFAQDFGKLDFQQIRL